MRGWAPSRIPPENSVSRSQISGRHRQFELGSDLVNNRVLSFAKTSSASVDQPMLSRQAKEHLGDCRQEGRPAVRVRRAATEGRRTFGGVGRRAA